MLHQLTLPAVIFCSVAGFLMFRSLTVLFELSDTRRRILAVDREFGGKLKDLLATMLRCRDRDSSIAAAVRLKRLVLEYDRMHPTARVLLRCLTRPLECRQDIAVTSWIAEAINEALGRIRVKLDQVRSAAPVLGVLGTVVGFMIATAAYSESRSQGELMRSVSMALLTTLLGSIIVLVVRWYLDGTLDPLETRLFLNAQESVGQVRVLLGRIPDGLQAIPLVQVEAEEQVDDSELELDSETPRSFRRGHRDDREGLHLESSLRSLGDDGDADPAGRGRSNEWQGHSTAGRDHRHEH